MTWIWDSVQEPVESLMFHEYNKPSLGSGMLTSTMVFPDNI